MDEVVLLRLLPANCEDVNAVGIALLLLLTFTSFVLVLFFDLLLKIVLFWVLLAENVVTVALIVGLVSNLFRQFYVLVLFMLILLCNWSVLFDFFRVAV